MGNHVQATLQEPRLKALLERRGRKVLRSVLVKALAGLSTHLQHKRLAREAGAQADAVHVVCVGDVVLNAMQDTSPGGGVSPMDASLAHGLSCHTCLGIDVLQGQDGEREG